MVDVSRFGEVNPGDIGLMNLSPEAEAALYKTCYYGEEPPEQEDTWTKYDSDQLFIDRSVLLCEHSLDHSHLDVTCPFFGDLIVGSAFAYHNYCHLDVNNPSNAAYARIYFDSQSNEFFQVTYVYREDDPSDTWRTEPSYTYGVSTLMALLPELNIND